MKLPKTQRRKQEPLSDPLTTSQSEKEAGFSTPCRMCDRSSKCWFLLCLFIYPTHSEVTPGVSCGGSPVCAFGCMDTYPTPLMCTPTTTITTTHQASHWAALSKNITREKRWKNTCLVWWRNKERERWRSNGPNLSLTSWFLPHPALKGRLVL